MGTPPGAGVRTRGLYSSRQPRPIPLVSSALTPMTLGATIPGVRLGGPQVALQALSTLYNARS